jgi:CRP/FNR family transcriptional regulator
MDIRPFLSKTFLFGSFTEQEIGLLLPATSLKKVARGEQLFSEGSDATAFFIILSGKVKIYKLSPDGKEYIVHIHGPGEPIAEAAIFDAMVYPASCSALEDTALIRIARDGFIRLIKGYPELSLKMMAGYSKRLRQFVKQVEELSLKDIKARLAGYLLENSIVELGVTTCHLPYSKKELSSLLGTVPETLSRALTFLKRKKLVAEKDTVIIIPDPEKLRRFGEL